MYGDMAVVRSDAAVLRAQGDDVRARALGIKARADAMNWNSTAATAFRAEIGITAGDLGRSAAALDTAADALIMHARISSVPDQLNNVTVSVFRVFGVDVAPETASRAEDVVRAVPTAQPTDAGTGSTCSAT